MIEELKRFMKRKKWTQYKVAQELSIPPQTVNRWIKKKVNMSNAYQQLVRLMISDD